MKKEFFIFILMTMPCFLFAQGTVRGDLMVNSSFYINDPRLGQYGTNTTQYKKQLSSAESWLYLNYNVNGYDVNLRYDLFNNSALLNPQEAFTSQGMPYFNISKKIDNKLEVTVGSFYDQFGSGILFRAYEDRIIGIDFAMQGIRLKYSIKPNLNLKAFTGKQKFRFGTKPEVAKGINLEGLVNKNDFGLTYGVSAVNRTLTDENDILLMASEINSYDLEDRFIPRYNVFGGQAYATINYKKWNLRVDGATKTHEGIFNYQSKLEDHNGYYGLASLSFTTKKFGVNATAKRSNYFMMRTSPYTALNPIIEGTIGYQAPINRQNTYRLPARYSPAVQELGELGGQIDLNFVPNKKNLFNLNLCYIEQPNILKEKLYHEIFATYQRNFSRKFKLILGYQNLFYNQKVYQGKPATTPNVLTSTPFIESTIKLTKKVAAKVEVQYLFTKQDLGDFAFALVEVSFAPHYSITFSDMVNTKPVAATRNPIVAEGELVHYPTVFFVYTHQQTRFTMGYIKQVEGVICTGGVCRVEPAFSGFRLGLTTNF